MTSRFEGTWKLTAASNTAEYYKSIGMSDAEMALMTPFDEVANDVTYVSKINGDDAELITNVGGKQVDAEKFTFGKPRELKYQDIAGECTTTLEGDVITDIFKKAGWEDMKYERTLVGDKLMVKMSSSKGVTATKELTKQ